MTLGAVWDGAMTNLKMEFASLRTGRASASMLEPGNGGRLRRNNSYQPSLVLLMFLSQEW